MAASYHILAVLVVLLLFGCTQQDHQEEVITGQTYYVNSSDAGASDANDGLSEQHDTTTGSGPWKTIGKATESMEAGDATIIMAGTYYESDLAFEHSGREGEPILLAALEGVVLDGSRTSGRAGIRISSGQKHITIRGLTIQNMEEAGLMTEDSPDAPYQGIRIERTQVTKNGKGIHLSSHSGLIVDSVRATENREVGIQITGSDSGIVTNCQTIANGHHGFLFDGCNNNTIGSNFSSEHEESGFTFVESSGNTFEKNEAFQNEMRGVTFMDNSQNNTLRENDSHHNGILGFAFYTNANKNTLRNNVGHHNRVHGFVILHHANENYYYNNVAHNNRSGGFYFEETTNSVLEGNIARDNNYDGFIFFIESTGHTLKNNIAKNNGGYGFLADQSSLTKDWEQLTQELNSCIDNKMGMARRVSATPEEAKRFFYNIRQTLK